MTNLVRWEPFRELISLREAMDRLFEESFVRPWSTWLTSPGEGTLAVDMYETDDAIIVKSPIPGVKPEDLDISITGDTLTIRGETRAETEVKEEKYIRRECRYGSFCRSLPLPVPVVADKAVAEFENGVLTLTLPKAEEVKPKTIKVKTKGE
ncbi:MAG: Hsp20/alpha crystallin family protein [Anaerolineae bacterium]|nr:Hsp20/alpha crystallin family protein [Anaerolineae bacterium]